MAKEESTKIVKSETRLRVPEEGHLMIPSAGGVLSKTDQLKTAEDYLRPKEK